MHSVYMTIVISGQQHADMQLYIYGRYTWPARAGYCDAYGEYRLNTGVQMGEDGLTAWNGQY